jgi:tRNA modification GTPase
MNREGRLSSRVRGIRENVLDLLSQIEACIDFSEEIGELDHSQIEVSARTLADALSAVLVEGRNAHLVRRGLRVAILGRPNAGKSSLLNALVGIDRAIVSDVPGTTRDTVEEAIEVDGIRIVLTDTAGLRETEDTVESLGVERSKRAADTADLILCVFDSEVGWTQEDESFVRSCAARVLVVGNKCDLSVPDRGLPVSCKTGEGVPILMKAMVEGLADLSEMPPVNERQGAALSLALDSLRACAEAASAMRPPDLLCVLLGEAVSYLGRVTGETATPDMLEEIFSRFCIGK